MRGCAANVSGSGAAGACPPKQELFRQLAAHAQPAARGHDQSYNIRHSEPSIGAQTSQAGAVCQAALRFANGGADNHNAPHADKSHPQLAALVAMLPLTAAAVAARLGRNLLLWLLLAAALAGPAGLVVSQISAGCSPGFRRISGPASRDLAGLHGALRHPTGGLPPRCLAAAFPRLERRPGDCLLRRPRCGGPGRPQWRLVFAPVVLAVASYATLTLAAIAERRSSCRSAP